jgi:chaperone LolA
VRPPGALFLGITLRFLRFARYSAACFALVFASATYAGGVERLKAFISGAKTAEADFTQTVTDKSGRVTQQASGKMAFARPGKFRWDYAKPYAQVIVGDGVKLWLYDADLNQVTVKPLGEIIAGTPAALLAGDHAIEKFFTLQDAGNAGGLEWLQATPKNRDTSFERIRMGFNGDTLVQMELFDFFGQRTTLRLSNFARNPAIAASHFRFSPPKGADIIGD